jgi:nucleoside-diphosphate-sugar epimerase
MKKIILIAGATGNLGLRIANALASRDVTVRALVRSNSNADKITSLEKLGVEICKVDNWSIDEIKSHCSGVSCVVSVLAGLRDVVIDSQKVLLDAAIAAGVPRFIPSDYSLDFTSFSNGENRNLDLRREFHLYLDKCPIAATSIFNGAFMELLLDEMPMIVFNKKLVIYWGKGDYKWGFTTMDNTAAYTANVAIDDNSPRYLRIAGDMIAPREVRNVISEITGSKYKLIRIGGQGLLGLFIKMARLFSPSEKELYPAWQGMQYMHNMIDERSNIVELNNNRYSNIKWTSVKMLLQEFVSRKL